MTRDEKDIAVYYIESRVDFSEDDTPRRIPMKISRAGQRRRRERI